MDSEEFFTAFLLPVCVAFILPVAIVLVVNLTKKAKYEKKFSFLEKCVENGVEINSDLLLDEGKKSLSSKATLKTMLLNRLAGGVCFTLLGLSFLIGNIFSQETDLPKFAIAITAVGVGLLVWYFVGKKMLAEDIKDEEQALQQLHNKER